ncbi:hypothetical protein CAI16_10130 [Virgibacillus dokdonensis]|uniref:Uncharacterized protein n=2 Tax=Virgibacillus TaxID=84406 RepID=A0A2K9J1I3_9BACI|nr:MULTISPECIES: hypothetical protein [Virgibacillus]AUJ25545.1 hypothetical protein A21D_02498 [Virgibacillus dokdonensis]NWO14020.1 hypothetical protein [Virgibacillus sp.]RFA34949.1 hypothetical protein CAI16_10130 [Virgibacillus dokdonensis]SHG99672.1 hypothetical protein SAMN05421807_10318 [Virgibacillus chiguensis]
MAKYEMKVYKDVLYFNYFEMAGTKEEAEKHANAVKEVLQKPEIKKFLNDNSKIIGVAKPEVNMVWGKFMEWVSSNIEKNATVAPSVALKMQLNRLSRTAGTYDSIRAFTKLDEALEFMGIPEFKINEG